jgi:hypothetical protein
LRVNVSINATSVPLFSTMSMKLASTFALRPRTVWAPFIEVSQPYGTNLKIHPGAPVTGATTGGEGGGKSVVRVNKVSQDCQMLPHR